MDSPTNVQLLQLQQNINNDAQTLVDASHGERSASNYYNELEWFLYEFEKLKIVANLKSLPIIITGFT